MNTPDTESSGIFHQLVEEGRAISAGGPDAWTLVYEGFEPAQEGLREALCTLGNGRFATRGAAPEAAASEVHYPGTYLAGGYNRLSADVHGRQVENEDLVNYPNWLPLSFRIGDGDWFRLDRVELLEYRQALDLRRGVLRRELRCRDPEGRITRWCERRLVSMADPRLAALEVSLEAENWSGEITIRSALDGSVTNSGVARYRALPGRHLEVLDLGPREDRLLFLRTRACQSRLEVALAARTRLYRDGMPLEVARECHDDGAEVGEEQRLTLQQGESVTIEKVVGLASSRDHAVAEPGLEALKVAGGAGRFATLLADHALAWKQLWEISDIELDDPSLADTELKLRLHMFHLLQTASPHTSELDAGIPARGWHGEAYRGHIFWDELFAFPFLNLRLPSLTAALLRYRYRRLPEARLAAATEGLRGAMYPWQSGSDGREETQHLHLNPKSGRWLPDTSHRQRHVNAAIAYNIWQYLQVTGDQEFMCCYGAEMMLEIARFWASIATFNPDRERYEIRGVMGPDEYHTAYPDTDPEQAGGIDNNAYTNLMAAWLLTRARDVLELLPRTRRERLCERLRLGPDELAHWEDVSRRLYVPFHGENIISQFEGYEKLEEFDWAGYRERYGDIHRLDRILEAEGDTPNRYQASKQADVLMLFYLFSSEELQRLFEQLGYRFEPADIPRNIAYYLERTSHGSTLSQVVHAWVLARSDRAQSWALFCQALDSDVADIQGGTTPEGIHIGAMAGTIDLVQNCYLGLGLGAGVLHLDPVLPDDLRRLRVRVHYRGQALDITADHDRLEVRSDTFATTPITIAYRGRCRELAPGDRCEFLLVQPPG
jgi:alpha,alpha-trehalase